MNPLESRKQLLIAESELNRAQLAHELQTMVQEVRSFVNQARTIGSYASAAASLVAGLAVFRRKKTTAATEKPSWLQTILNGAQLAGSLWSEFRPRGRDHKDK